MKNKEKNMKIKKFPQSCILVETNGTKILIDPGSVKFDEKFVTSFKSADAILVTHRHSDHINAAVLQTLARPIYSTSEVSAHNPNLSINIIKNGDVFKIGKVQVEVVKALHGFISADGDVLENVGFILDDGKTRLYVTSDTIRFKNNYKADVIFADVTAFDASMNLWGAAQTARDVGARLLIVAHQEGGKVLYDKKQIADYLTQEKVNFLVPEIGQEFEI